MEWDKLKDITTFYRLNLLEFEDKNGIYYLKTEEGQYCLKMVKFNIGRINFITDALEYLKEKGFTKFPAVYIQDQEHFYQEGDQSFLLFQWIDGVKSKLVQIDEILLATQTLIEFHKVAKGFTPKNQDIKIKDELGKWPTHWQRICRQINYLKDEVKSKKIKSTFDQTFIKSADYFSNQAERAILMLKDSRYLQLCYRGQQEKTFCHHSLSNSNMILTKENQIYLLDFDRVIFDLHVHDLCNFMRRLLPGVEWSDKVGLKIVDFYLEEIPLTKDELNLLYILLYFPFKYWHTLRRYYIKGSVKSEKLEKYLNDTIGNEVKKQKFLKAFRDKYL